VPFSLRQKGDIAWLEVDEFRREGVIAALSTRQGGFSQGAFRSLNLGFSSGDDPNLVAGNRRLFFAALGIEASEVVVADQVHGSRVLDITEEMRGHGATDRRDTVGEADALVTGVPRTFLLEIFADCVPILFADPSHRACAIAHSGWRGTAKGVGEEVVHHMAARFGSRPRDVLVAIGPSIAPPSYEVGDEVRRAILERYPWAGAHLVGGQADLRAVIRGALLRQGVVPERLTVSDHDTFQDEDLFFSYRRDGPRSGRMAGVIGFDG